MLSSAILNPEASRLVACIPKSAPTSRFSLTRKPSRAPQENASLGSTRTSELSFALPLTPSLKVQPAVPLISTRASCADAVATVRAPSAAVRIVLRIIVCLSFFMFVVGALRYDSASPTPGGSCRIGAAATASVVASPHPVERIGLRAEFTGMGLPSRHGRGDGRTKWRPRVDMSSLDSEHVAPASRVPACTPSCSGLSWRPPKRRCRR